MVADDPADVFDVQSSALRLFLAMRLYRPVWRGALLLGVGLGGPGRALALATLAAGAVGLFLDDDAALLRQAQREGCSTFTVTALEEAVRILKNEVRQGRTIAVALRQAPASAMAEMLRRGLQPAVLAFSRPASDVEGAHLTVLQQRGAVTFAGLGLSGSPDAVDFELALQGALGSGWGIHTDTASTVQQRRQQDAELLAAAESCRHPAEPLSTLAVEWLRVAPALLPRSFHRPHLLPVPPG